MFNNTFPGQNAPPDNYQTELTAIVQKLKTYTQAWGAQLAFAHTTPYLCTAQQDGCVQYVSTRTHTCAPYNHAPPQKTNPCPTPTPPKP
jgi:hypothetical protein